MLGELSLDALAHPLDGFLQSRRVKLGRIGADALGTDEHVMVCAHWLGKRCAIVAKVSARVRNWVRGAARRRREVEEEVVFLSRRPRPRRCRQRRQTHVPYVKKLVSV